jgi:hypothetical protein
MNPRRPSPFVRPCADPLVLLKCSRDPPDTGEGNSHETT